MEPIELHEFVEKGLKDIETAAHRRHFVGGIEFEVVVSKVEKIDGKLNVYVAGAVAGLQDQHIGKIKFTIRPPIHPDNMGKIINQPQMNVGF